MAKKRNVYPKSTGHKTQRTQKKTVKKKQIPKTQKIKRPAINTSQALIWLVVILIATFIAYYPTLDNGITNFDDNLYITENPYLQRLGNDGVSLMFSEYYMGNYHPLSMISLAIDYEIGGYDYFYYHLTNIIIHVINTALVFFFVLLLVKEMEYVKKVKDKIRGTKSRALPIAIITAALFGLHTIHLESVGWVSERKDVLYTMFFVGSLITYIKYIQQKNNLYLVLTAILFILSLLSKGQAVSLTVTLLAIDFAMRRDLKSSKVWLEKIPFFILSIIFGIIAIYAQQSSKSIVTDTAVGNRIFFASYGFMQYIFKLVAPVNLSVFYPYPATETLPAHFYIYPFLVLAVIGGLIYAIKKNYRLAAFGILFFAINIFLLLQLLPVGKAIMADRYSYIPSIGFFLLVGLGYKLVVQYFSGKQAVQYAMIAVLIAYSGWLGYKTYDRTEVWESSMSLWEDVLEQFPDTPLALNNLGDIKSNLNPPDLKGALKDFNRALELDPNYDQTYYNRGVVLAKLSNKAKDKEKRLQLKKKAITDFNKAIELRPRYAEAYSNRGATKFEMGMTKQALQDFDSAIVMKKNYFIAYSNRGSAKALMGDGKGALQDFNMALKIQPKNGKVYYMRGITKYGLNMKDSGCKDLYRAIQLGYKSAQKDYNKKCK